MHLYKNILFTLLAASTARAGTPADIEALLKAGPSAAAVHLQLEAEKLEAATSGTEKKIVADTAASGGQWVLFEERTSGEYIEFTVPSLPAGYYELAFSYNRDPNRGALVVGVNGSIIGSFINQRSREPEGYVRTGVGTFFQPKSGSAVIRLSHIGTMGGTRPWLSIDTLFIDSAPLRNTAAPGIPPAANGNLRVDAIAMARQLMAHPPAPGPACAPYYALPKYKPDGSSIPAGALDRKDFATTPAWLDAMTAQKKPGKIGSGRYELAQKDFPNCALSQSIYGYDSGQGMPVLNGMGRSSLFYLMASGITLQYLQFENIGIAVLCFDHWQDYGMGGKKGLHQWHTYQPDGHPDKIHDADIDNISIMDCRFIDVGMAMLIIKEFHGVHNIHVGRNTATGGKGFVALPTYDYRDIHFYQNTLHNFDQKTEGGNWANTLFWIGTNATRHKERNQNVFLEFNSVDDVSSSHAHYKVNASAFCDIRDSANVSIAYNTLKNMTNSAANSDCNAVYSKTDDLMIDHCLFENCGANDSTNEADIGSEGGCLTLKGDTSDQARFGTIVQNCIFDAGSITEVPLLLFCHRGIMRNCTFKNWQWTGSDKQRRYLIHQYSGDSLCFINPTFINCGGKGALIYREANSVSAMIGWKDIDFNNQSTAVFSGVNFTAGALNGRGEKLVNE